MGAATKKVSQCACNFAEGESESVVMGLPVATFMRMHCAASWQVAVVAIVVSLSQTNEPEVGVMEHAVGASPSCSDTSTFIC